MTTVLGLQHPPPEYVSGLWHGNDMEWTDTEGPKYQHGPDLANGYSMADCCGIYGNEKDL